MVQRLHLLAIASLSAAIALGAAASAQAMTYSLSGVQLSDGATVSGSFTLNVSGYPAGYDITTTAGSLSGFHYNGGINAGHNPGDATITFYNPSPAYDGYLTLAFAQPIGAGGQALLTGIGGPSLECDTYGCPTVSAHDRYVVSGSVIIPEPGIWTLMIAGLGAICVALRRRTGLAVSV